MSAAPELVTRTQDRRNIIDAVRAVWPPPARLTLGPRRAPSDEGTTYVPISVSGKVRWLVPQAAPRAAAQVVGAAYDGSDVKARVLRRLAATGLRLGIVQLLSGERLRVSTPDGTAIEDHLAGVLGRHVVLIVRLGFNRGNRKPVLQVLTSDGETLAYAKVSCSPSTDLMVRNEAAALIALGSRSFRRLRSPSVRWAGGWGEHELLVQSPLRPLDAPRVVGPPLAAMRELGEAWGVEEEPLQDSPWWQRLRATALPLDASGRLGPVLDAVERAWGSRRLLLGAGHGDWTSWNSICHPDATLVWDWERFERGVPLGSDAGHWVLQEALRGNRLHGWRSAAAAGAGALTDMLPRLGAPADAARPVMAAHLSALAVRYAAETGSSAGARLSVLLDEVLNAIEDLADTG